MDKHNITAIVPFLNESECIDKFCAHIDQVGQMLPCDLEIVFIDDGSVDDTVSRLRGWSFKNCVAVKVLVLSKNYGSHAAIRAGIKNATYDNVVFLCADLQEPDDMIIRAYSELLKGYDAIYIEKEDININKFDRYFSLFYSWLMRKFAVNNYGGNGISNIMFNGKIKQYLNSHIENNSSVHLQIIDSGFRCKTLKMKYNAREKGSSKWTLAKKIKLFIDSFVAFSFMPIRLVSIIGIIMFICGFFFGLYIILNKLFGSYPVAMGYATLASLLALGFGITNISLGIIAEYLWRTYAAARNRPVFIISEIINIKGSTVDEDRNL